MAKTKAEMYPERVTIVISTKQRAHVDTVARAIQTNGVYKKERITANTIFRCLIDLLKYFEGDISEIKNERDVRRTFRKFFRARVKNSYDLKQRL